MRRILRPAGDALPSAPAPGGRGPGRRGARRGYGGYRERPRPRYRRRIASAAWCAWPFSPAGTGTAPGTPGTACSGCSGAERSRCVSAAPKPSVATGRQDTSTTTGHGARVASGGGQQVIDHLAEHPERQGADRGPAGERAGPLRRTRRQPRAERVRAVRLDADRQRDRGIEAQAAHDAGQRVHHAEPAHAAQADPPGPDGHRGGRGDQKERPARQLAGRAHRRSHHGTVGRRIVHPAVEPVVRVASLRAPAGSTPAARCRRRRTSRRGRGVRLWGARTTGGCVIWPSVFTAGLRS